MFVLVVISLFFAFSENEGLMIYDRVIWLIFVIDYCIRLWRSKKRWNYIKSHPLELIAIIPLDSIFRAARFVRIFRVIRLLGIGSRFLRPVYGILQTNGLDKLLIVTMILLFLIPIPIILVEPVINTFPDALWWAIVTTTTVGYGDISPTTGLGRILAVVLMLVGIGIIGTFTSSITSYFSKENKMTHDKKVLQILQTIEELEEFDENDAELIQLYLERKKKISRVETHEKEYNPQL
ncbi:potassium channel family protein [Planomicrobium okeanokoites]|uniref:potassium channel family protein n=1 Tax=Planomicrobium okeanokoites TaxID=244 RepID=UPI001FD3D95A|nr:potassium channel family protein [Planomicrobium okeanokoites]